MSGSRAGRSALRCAVLALLLAAAVSACGSPPTRQVRTGISPGGHFPHQSIAAVTRDLEAVADLGVGWVRVDLAWPVAEPQRGRYEWDLFDHVVRTARDKGIKVLAMPAYTPGWARPPGTSDKHPPSDPADFAAFVAAASERYDQDDIAAWEIWNEPNLSHFWSPAADPAGYVRLLAGAVRAIRSADRSATILSAGLAPAPDSDGNMSPETFLTQFYAEGGGALVDALADHPYSYPATPDAPVDGGSAVDRLKALRRIMVANGDKDKKIWLTEFGAPTAGSPGAISEQAQAVMLLQAYRLFRRLPWTGPLFFYTLRDNADDVDDRESNFGLLRRDGTAKPGWDAVVRLTRT